MRGRMMECAHAGRRVDADRPTLPQPLGPMSASISPGLACIVILCSMGLPPGAWQLRSTAQSPSRSSRPNRVANIDIDRIVGLLANTCAGRRSGERKDDGEKR